MAHATSRALPTVRVVRRPTSLLTIGSVACTPFLEDLRATWPWSHRGELARVGVDLEAVGGQAQLVCRFEGQHQEGKSGLGELPLHGIGRDLPRAEDHVVIGLAHGALDAQAVAVSVDQHDGFEVVLVDVRHLHPWHLRSPCPAG